MPAQKPSCLECGEHLVGRADKKFCSDQCRNAFNNRQNRDVNNIVRNINNSLRKNRRILSDACSGEKTKISRDKLARAGFNFNYFTHEYRTKTDSVYKFCYEMGYLELENEEVLIVRRD